MAWLTLESLEEGLDILGIEGATEEIHPGIDADKRFTSVCEAFDGYAGDMTKRLAAHPALPR